MRRRKDLNGVPTTVCLLITHGTREHLTGATRRVSASSSSAAVGKARHRAQGERLMRRKTGKTRKSVMRPLTLNLTGRPACPSNHLERRIRGKVSGRFGKGALEKCRKVTRGRPTSYRDGARGNYLLNPTCSGRAPSRRLKRSVSLLHVYRSSMLSIDP